MSKKWIWRSTRTIDTFADAQAYFLSRKEGKHCAPNTLAAYERDINTLCRYIHQAYDELPGPAPENIPINYLTADVLNDAFQLYSADHAISSHHRCHTVLNGMCNALVEGEKIPLNPMIKVDAPQSPRQALPKTYSPHALKKLLTYLADPGEEDSPTRWARRDHAMILVLISSGMRAGELRGLTLGDCQDASDNSGAILLHLLGKGNKQRVASIEAPVASVVTEYLSQRCLRRVDGLDTVDARDPWATLPRTAPLFVTTKGAPLTKGAMESRVERALKRAGVWEHKAKGTLIHQFRHTFATMLADDPEVTAFQLQRLLGHASLSATERYTAAAGRGVRQVASRNPVYSMLNDDQLEE